MDNPCLEDQKTEATVLANKVEELGTQPAMGAQEISQRTPINEIGPIIDKLTDISNSIGSALEELTWVAHEIGRHAIDSTMAPPELGRIVPRFQEPAATSAF
jgi:hypothetical protein